MSLDTDRIVASVTETGRHLRDGVPGNRSRAQIGASTIIILIASLLVAASTVALLYNVTGTLRTQAETTERAVGAQTNEEVRFAAMTGRVNTSTDPATLTEVRVIVALDEQSSPVNLADAIVRLETDEGIDTLTYDTGGPVAGETFGVVALSDPDDSVPRLTSVEDRFAIRIVPPPLTVHDRVVVRVYLESGEKLVVYGRVPSTAEGNHAVTLE
ncbi:MAG: hypothetical protein ABEJ44_01070 [Halanaeroarchaeum sp.]